MAAALIASSSPTDSPAPVREPVEAVVSHGAPMGLAEGQKVLRNYVERLHAGQGKDKVPMLDPREDIRSACRFTSDWLVGQGPNLDILWKYLESRNPEWTNSVMVELRKVIELAKPLGPGTPQEVEAMISNKLVDGHPVHFKCGIALSFLVSKNTQVEAQTIGANLMGAALTFIAKDAESKDPAVLAKLHPVVPAAISAIKAAFHE